jgi:dipeptidyl aminopeptidase/acylaminoacyl peptidase
MNSTTKLVLLRIPGVAFGIATVAGATIGGGLLRVLGTVAAPVPEPAQLLALWTLVATSFPLYRWNRAWPLKRKPVQRNYARRLTINAATIGIVLVSQLAWCGPPSVDAFASLPAMTDVALSPNGKLLAFSDNGKNVPVVVVFDIDAAKRLRQISIGDEYKLRDITWSDDETVLVELSQTQKSRYADADRFRFEIFRTLAIDVTTGKANVLLMTGGSRNLVTGATLEATRTGKPKTVLMSTLDYSAAAERPVTDTKFARGRADSGWIHVLFEVSTETGKGKLLESGGQFTDQWIVDSSGACVARSEWDPEHAGYRVLAKQARGWKEIFSRARGPTLALQGLTPDGATIVAIGANDAGKRVVYGIGLDGSGLNVLFEDPENDVRNVILDRFSRTPVAAVLGGLKQEWRWLDPAAKARTDSVARAFKGKNVEVYGRSLDGKRMLARVGSPSEAGVYYLVDFNRRSADIIGEEYPGLVNVQLGEVRGITYKARDGTDIPAYLTLPPQSTGKGLPMVILPHGGPRANDSLAFDYWAQFLATRGYAVLQPQFRGSTGFGRKFEEAGFRQWGGLMQDDISDGVKAMVTDGVADSKRVCIVGASYGGYAALAGAVFTPKLYRCAASYAGVSNIPQMLAFDRERYGADSPLFLELVRTIGDPDDPALGRKSPVNSLTMPNVPVLLLHGQDDTVVPISHSDSMARVLKESNGSVTYLKLPGEDHWLSRGATRLQVLTEIEKFLAANLLVEK